ncbi:hypothetical protein HZ326_24413 [Fusarium oxysporum f. sp. albedinis]|nr:hypothetical protein HZ326_24413 [Fusarium oxysporum f. sp. albedinis]
MEHTRSPFAWEGFFLGPLVVRLLDLDCRINTYFINERLPAGLISSALRGQPIPLSGTALKEVTHPVLLSHNVIT